MNTTRIAAMAFTCVLAVAASAMAQQADMAGSKDHPLFTRMPDTYIWRYEASDFDVHRFRGAGGTKVEVEGRKP